MAKYELTKDEQARVDRHPTKEGGDRLRAHLLKRGQERLDAEKADAEEVEGEVLPPATIPSPQPINIKIDMPPQQPAGEPRAAAAAPAAAWRSDVASVWNTAVLLGLGALLGAVFLAPLLLRQFAKLVASLGGAR